jgi:UDP-N-acetylglucosamine 1-carboxyvinyltransferase
MANLIVHGGTPLTGRIIPSANKNAVLPILCATLLTQAPVRLLGIPEITDVRKIIEIYRMLGSEVQVDYASGVLDACWTSTTIAHSSTRRRTICLKKCVPA